MTINHVHDAIYVLDHLAISVRDIKTSITSLLNCHKRGHSIMTPYLARFIDPVNILCVLKALMAK